GKAIRFSETDVRPLSRSTRGVTGIRMSEGNRVISMSVVAYKATFLAISENGYGKRTAVSEYNTQKRGGQGVFTLKTGGRNGDMIGALQVLDDDQVMMMTDSGRLVRIRMNGINVIGRNTQGVTLIDCSKKERVIGAVRVVEKQDESDGENTVESDFDAGDFDENATSDEPSENTPEKDTGDNE
ncbi:MAG: DNA gyrase subunit A, partial [Ghiorsea sp.]|nr:DNA gyrase subunit A [Ghiorsea sp.]